MITPQQVKEIKQKKKEGILNHVIMKEYNISYGELRMILDTGETK